MSDIPFFDLRRIANAERSQLHAALDEVIDSGQFIGGTMVERFEREFASFVQNEQCIAVGNGLDAIRLLLEAHQIGPGDEVIVPAFTYYASWLAVMQVGAKLVPVDVDLATSSMRAELVEAAVTSRTKAILVVHLYGIPTPMDELRHIAERSGVKLFEDTAQAHGAKTDVGTMCGGSSDGGAFSFYPTKNLGALGDAGAVVVNDSEVARRIRSRRSYGQGASKYDHVDTGWNSRLDPLQAGFLSIHLKQLSEWTTRRREIARQYYAALAGAENAVVAGQQFESSVWHHFVVRATHREQFMERMSALGVTTDVHYPYWFGAVSPVLQFSDAVTESAFPIAAQLASEVVSMPMGPWLSADEVSRVAEALNTCRDDLAC